MTQTVYTRDILRLAVSIPHQGRLDQPDGTAEKRSQTCGSRVIADIMISDDNEIDNLGLEINACALGQASAAILGGQAIGKSILGITHARERLASFLSGNTDVPGDWDNIDLLAPAKDHAGRHAAILLPYDALIAAFDVALTEKGEA